MVCALDEASAICCVREGTKRIENTVIILAPASWCVSDLFEEVGRKMDLHPDSFNLVLIGDKNGNTVLNNKSVKIEMAGLELRSKNELMVCVKPDYRRTFIGEEYTVSEEITSPTVSGDYATPVGPPPPPPPPPPLPASSSSSGDYNHSGSLIRHEIGYVGLVNQAMTCYLNSLLQALFMTPEFRNALYNWEFDGSQNDESKSIPYQLQKLFLNLQTSHKSAVETTELTRSFGWDSSEAWQQHDIQELCRVMFDALEQKFKNTEQSDLINRLYEGKMIDYVKCLECSTEKFREDTFLDIPLPLRPFRSNIAYGSVEEALRAFVQPETLDGNNQYHCEKCNKKCDAHKGLKFSKFPYLLTLHLKRFDFDYSTLHRIKLNDKVTFPEKLNLNSFIFNSTKGEDIINESSPEETAVKYDDSSTTDSGSALDDEGCQGIDAVPVSNSHENHNTEYQEDDEGIDVCQNNENEKNKQNVMDSGPYIYELFSIMIHSGSAAGGHYYAYIKDFKDGEWYCFNDQSVTKITYEDIKKTYGGGPHRGYYSIYSSSTNAYMLMYRQIDPERNSSAMTVEEFPPHIKALHKKLEEQKEMECRMRDSDLNLFKVKIYCCHPEKNVIVEKKMHLPEGLTLREGVKLASTVFNLDEIVPLECCRLVMYDRAKDSIECSFEGKEDELLCDLLQDHKSDLLLEIRKEGEEFEVYKPGNIITKVYLINLETEEVKGPVMVRGNVYETVREYKETVAKHLKLPVETLHILVQHFDSEPKVVSSDDIQLRQEDIICKIYAVSLPNEEDIKKPQIFSKIREIIDIFGLVITLHIALPNVDNDILEILNIPPLEQPQSTHSGQTLNIRQTDELLTTHSRGASPNDRDSSPQPLPDPEDECMGPAEPHSDQSASEDSSLTDSERTIVGEAPGDCLAQLSPSNSSVGSDQNVSSPENEGNDHDLKPGELRRNARRKFKNCFSNFPNNEIGEGWDAEEHASADDIARSYSYYFKASPYTDNNTNQKMLEVSVDKRMNQRTLKQCLEPYVGVSADHFKIYKPIFGYKEEEFECYRPTESLRMFMDDDKLTIKLGRVLKKGEYVGNVYLLALNIAEPFKFLCEWVIANGSSVGQVKKEILEEIKKKRAIAIQYNRCRLRKKIGKNPGRPYLDNSTFDDLSNHWEMILQVLPGDEPVTSPSQMLLFVRQWCPSTLDLKHFQEIVLDTNLVSECKEKISQLSGIPVEFIDIAKAHGPFPCVDVSVLGIHSDLDWKTTASVLDKWPLNITGDGQVIFFRDNRERVKHLSNDERKEILSLENRGRLGSSSMFSYSPRKERALKIYLDTTPPRRREEEDVDW